MYNQFDATSTNRTQRYPYITDVESIDFIVKQCIKDKKTFYIAGILGCSMGSIGDYLRSRSAEVKGVDTKSKDPTVYSSHRKENIDNKVGAVIISHIFNEKPYEDIEEANRKGLPIILRLDFLNYIFYDNKRQYPEIKLISIFGTSGKTTTTQFFWSVSRHLNMNPSVFCGGYLEAVAKNYYLGTGDIILEHDESSIDHLKVTPDILVLLSMTPDHLEGFGYDNDFEKMRTSFLQQINNSKQLLYYSDLDVIDELVKKSNKYGSNLCASYSDINENSECFIYNIRPSPMGTTFSLKIKKNDKHIECDVAVPFTGRRNIINYAAAIYNVITPNNLEKILNFSRYIQLPGERNTYCGQINNMQVVNNFAQIVPEWLSVVKNYKEIFPDKDIFVVIEIVRDERYCREIQSIPLIFPYVKKILMAPVYSYSQSRYLASNELKPQDLQGEKYKLYDNLDHLHRDIEKLTMDYKGILMCFGFNTPFGMRLLNSKIKIASIS